MKLTKQKLKTALVIAMAYIGVIVGAGFASGQEILQYYVSHGLWGVIGGSMLALLLFALTGLILLQLGAKYDANSHKMVLQKISGPLMSKFLDYSMTITLVIVGVVMIAGAGANLNQQFGLPVWSGSLIASILIVVVGFMDTSKVVKIISAATPFLLAFVLIAAIYAISTTQLDISTLNALAEGQKSATPWWFLSAINYVSLSMMMGASMAIVMGGDEDKPKVAGLGGFIGGALVGIMIFLVALALLLRIRITSQSDMPLLALVNSIHPALGYVMAIVLFVMIFNTALSLYYSFVARVTIKHMQYFNPVLVATVVLSFAASFVGFKALLSIFYPIIGYVGIALMIILILAWVNNTRRRLRIARDESNDLSFMDTKV